MRTFSSFRGELVAFGEHGKRSNTPTENVCYRFKSLQSIPIPRMYACRHLFFTETCFGWPTLFWSPRKTGLRFANNARRTACRGKWRSLQEFETSWYLRTEIAPDEDYFAVASFKPSDDLPKAIPTILRVVCAWTRYSICGCFSLV